ncbi:MAG: DUF4397 domain-containing protein [Lachnospiraceae bacterium]|nr:DUF4397 domain-containing protein [Lachnospiraceae bacterium]
MKSWLQGQELEIPAEAAGHVCGEDGNSPFAVEDTEAQEEEWSRWQRETEMISGAPESLQGEMLHRDPACRVRFLHSAAGFGPLNIAAGEADLEALGFGQMSEFVSVPAGFALTVLYSARMPELALYKQSLLYPAGSVLTAAIVNTQQGIGIRMIPEL